MEYELFAKDVVFAQIQNLEEEIQDQIFSFFDRIKANPFIESDFKEERNGYSFSGDVVILGGFCNCILCGSSSERNKDIGLTSG